MKNAIKEPPIPRTLPWHFRRKSSNTNKTSSNPESPGTGVSNGVPQLPYKIHYKILSYLPFRSLLVAMKVNQTYERACHQLILHRFLSLPSLHFASAIRRLDETAGVYGFESLGRGDAHQYILEEDYPCDFRLISTFFITTWPIPESYFMEEISAGRWLKAFAIVVGDRSRWIIVFDLNILKRRRKAKQGKAISFPSSLELYYHGRPNNSIKGERSSRDERSKLVYVPESDSWYVTWPLSALVALGVMDDHNL